MINGISLRNLRNAEFDQFVQDVLELVLRNEPAALMVPDEYTNLKDESDRLSELLNPAKGSALTKKLEIADRRRDLCISGINKVVAGYICHFDPTIRQHAETLESHLAIYGKAALARENYQSETASVKSLIKDWDTQKHLTDALAALNLTTWKEELATANQEFADLYIGRTEEASAANPDTVKGLRQSMTQNYYKLRDMIGAYHMINKGVDPWGVTVKQVNVLITKYEALTGEPRSAVDLGLASEGEEPEGSV